MDIEEIKILGRLVEKLGLKIKGELIFPNSDRMKFSFILAKDGTVALQRTRHIKYAENWEVNSLESIENMLFKEIICFVEKDRNGKIIETLNIYLGCKSLEEALIRADYEA